MRIFIGGIAIETNSFSPDHADCEHFKKGYWYEDTEIEKLKKTSMDVNGFFRCLETQKDIILVPGFVTFGLTSGPVSKEAYARMSGLLIQKLRAALPLDGVLLALHGSMQSEDCDDCEGDIINRIREAVGPDVFITAAFDLHACLTPKIMEGLDGLSTYRTYPHTDHSATGFRAAEALVTLIREKLRPVKLFSEIPLIMAVENCNTNAGPITGPMAEYTRLLSREGVISGGMSLTQPWLDVPGLGCQAALFVKPGADADGFKKEMDAVLDSIWKKKEEFFISIPGIEEALEQSRSMEKPVHVVELGDIVSAGGMGDSTIALKALLNNTAIRPAALFITAPDMVKAAEAAGVGAAGEFTACGYIPKSYAGAAGFGALSGGYNAPVTVKARVVKLNRERVAPIGDVQKGVAYDMGLRALLVTEDGLHIIASELPGMNHDKQMLLSMDVNPLDMAIIIQHTHQMFKSGYKDVMGSFIYADTPGYTDRNFRNLPFKKARKALYPLNIDAMS